MKKTLSIIIIATISLALLFISAGCRYEATYTEEGIVDRSEIEVVSGDTAKAGDISWELIDVEDLGTEIQDEAGAVLTPVRGKFVFVSFSVQNSSDEGRTLYDMKVIDSKGRVYSICTEAYGYFSSNYSACTLANIPPGGNPLFFSASFDINLDSEELVLEVTDLLKPPQQKAYIDLGI